MGKKKDKSKEEKKKKKKKGRMACCEKEGMRKGSWTAEEDKILVDYITEHGHGAWRNLPKLAGLLRCGKSCRLRWTNYLRPNIRRGPFSTEEENTIIHLHGTLGNKWAAIASHLQGRTDNDVKNFWNSHLRKRFSVTNANQPSYSPKSVDMRSESPSAQNMVQWESVKLETESHLSTKPLVIQSDSKSEGDYFLRLWNSKVGESFRNINECTSEWGEASSHSPASQTSSLTKVELGSLATNQVEPCIALANKNVDFFNCKREADVLAICSDSLKSEEFDDSADAMLQLLLDFPAGGNDMEFLQESLDVDGVSASIRD